MKKMWVKKDNLYYRPFYKQKYKMTFLIFVITGFIFLAYQFFWMNQLAIDTKMIFAQVIANKTKIESNLVRIDKLEIVDNREPMKVNNNIRGVHTNLNRLYVTNTDRIFRCIKTGREISIDWLNDNYCDCLEDGSDETTTNACANGIFYCTHQKPDIKKSQVIPTSRLNDGICDCCDGSDEWTEVGGLTGGSSFVVKCKNTCV